MAPDALSVRSSRSRGRPRKARRRELCIAAPVEVPHATGTHNQGTAMSQNKWELTMRRTWLVMVGALAGFGAGLALFASSGLAQGAQQQQGEQQRFKEMKLTEKQIQSFIATQKKLAPLASKLEADQPDPALQKQVEQIAKSSGFSTMDEFSDVGANVSVLLAGLDAQTGQFIEPPDQIRRDMEEVKKDPQMSKQEKDQAVAQMQAALKTAVPLKFKENVALVRKYQKELEQALGEGQPEPQK
jgi:hypothetical protein